VSLAAARATLTVLEREDVPRRLGETGQALLAGIRRVAEGRPDVVAEVLGMPQMCFCRFRNEPQGPALAQAAARRGLLFKRSAYNFVSLAHGPGDIALTVEILAEAADEVARM
jgi:acetylornithine/succinyldiaminopimelate/putrescine aminotransferase